MFPESDIPRVWYHQGFMLPELSFQGPKYPLRSDLATRS